MTLKARMGAAAAAAALFGTTCPAEPQTAAITVHVDQRGHAISPWLYGIFFEEINHSGDGGLYAELVRNRSFEDAQTPEGWSLVGESGALALEPRTDAGEYNRHALSIVASGGPATVRNDGFWGMDVRRGTALRLSLSARAASGAAGPLAVKLTAPDGRTLAAGKTPALTAAWKRFSLTLKPSDSAPNARLEITAPAGTVLLDDVSLFPADTYKGRPNGMRTDLAEMLEDLSPAFMRFPGGCWVEGETVPQGMRWKATIGDPTQRRTQYNIWQYQSTNGLGYHEYLQLCEDLGAEPLFVINCGMSHQGFVPMARMDEYVQDALDAIEYANGPADSKWGSLRAKAGHPKPFGLKVMEIGNENGGPLYAERWPLFYSAIKAKYPDMKLIANVWGGYPTNPMPDIVDEHYYDSPQFFARMANHYDSYDRKGPKVYVGEYAVTKEVGQGNFAGALGEAAFMTGMERNSDIVTMSSYAPLFANVNYKRWNPNLINFDSSRVYGTPSYYVQRMFARNRGDETVPVELAVTAPADPTAQAGAIGVGTWRTRAEYKDITVTANGQTLLKSDFSGGLGDWKPASGEWSAEEGILRQTGDDENARIIAGDPTWTDYMLSLKARKISGDEGFLILFRVRDDNHRAWWNIGGWKNRETGIEDYQGGNQRIVSVPGGVETGRWYDIKLVVQGDHVQCFLDGVKVHDVTMPRTQPLFAAASRDKASGELILKVVNFSESDYRTTLNLAGARSVASSGTAIVLTGKPADENSLEQPEKVAPVAETITGLSAAATRTFLANSVTVLRVKAR